LYVKRTRDLCKDVAPFQLGKKMWIFTAEFRNAVSSRARQDFSARGRSKRGIAVERFLARVKEKRVLQVRLTVWANDTIYRANPGLASCRPGE